MWPNLNGPSQSSSVVTKGWFQYRWLCFMWFLKIKCLWFCKNQWLSSQLQCISFNSHTNPDQCVRKFQSGWLPMSPAGLEERAATRSLSCLAWCFIRSGNALPLTYWSYLKSTKLAINIREKNLSRYCKNLTSSGILINIKWKSAECGGDFWGKHTLFALYWYTTNCH